MDTKYYHIVFIYNSSLDFSSSVVAFSDSESALVSALVSVWLLDPSMTTVSFPSLSSVVLLELALVTLTLICR